MSKNGLTKEEILAMRKEKLQAQILSARRVLKSGIEPLEIADAFYRDIIEEITCKFRRETQEISDREIIEKVRENFSIHDQIKKRGSWRR